MFTRKHGKLSKRILAFMMALTMVLSYVPDMHVHASGTTTEDHGHDHEQEDVKTEEEIEVLEPVKWTDEMNEIQEMIDEIVDYYLVYYGFVMPEKSLIDAQWEEICAQIEDIVLNKMDANERENAVMSVREVEYMVEEYKLDETEKTSIGLANLVFVEFAERVKENSVEIAPLAVSGSLTDVKIVLTNSNGTWSANGTGITGTVKGGSFFNQYFAQESTLTITNNRNYPVVLYFDYSIHFKESGESYLHINGTQVQKSSKEGQTLTGNSGDITIEAGKSITVKVTAGKRSGDNTATLTISNIVAKGTVTFGAATNGRYWVGEEELTAGASKTDPCGTTYALKATPADGYAFLGWSINGSSDYISNLEEYSYINEGTVTITPVFGLAGITANFAEAQGSDGASGSYTVNGQLAPKEIVGAAGVTYTLVAVPDNATTMEFHYWYNATTGEKFGEYQEEVTVTVTEDTTIYPVFRMLDVYTITTGVNDSAMGTVTETSQVYQYSEFSVTATANEGYIFVEWQDADGNQVYTKTTYTFTPTSSMTLIAVFRKLDVYTITTGVNNPAMGTVTETSQVYEYDEVSVTATVNVGYFFVEWQDADGNQVSTKSTYTFTPTASTTLIAVFREATAYNVNVSWDTALGSVVKENITDNGIAYEGQEVKLTASPVTGSTFLGWVDENGNVQSTASTYSFDPENRTLRAVFAKDGGTPWFGVGTLSSGKIKVSSLYDNWDSAMAAGSYVVLMNNAKLPAREAAYEVPSGKTLLIPFDANNTLFTNAPECTTGYVKPTAFRTLTMESGAHIAVNGAISISGGQVAGGSQAGAPKGPVGFIHMQPNSSVTVNNGANLYAWGYITGTGFAQGESAVVIKKGGTVYEDFQVMNWRGGTAGTGMIGNSYRVFPLSQYYVQNVEVPMKLESGASEKGYTSVSISIVGIQETSFTFVGSGGLFNIDSGYIIKDYDEAQDRLIIDCYDGHISMDKISAKLSFYTINSGDYDLPINGNITVNIKSGSKITLKENVLLQPGAILNIEAGAECIVGEGKKVYIFDSEDWGDYALQAGQRCCPIIYAPGRANGVMFNMDSDAVVHIAGKVIGASGFVYVTAHGARITGEHGAIITTKADPSDAVIHQALQNNTTISYEQIQVKPAILVNGDGSMVDTSSATTATTYEYVGYGTDGKWLISCGKDENSDGAIEHNYSYDGEVVLGAMKSDATCTTPAIYYIQCKNDPNCKIVSDNHTVSSGSLKPHTLNRTDAVEANCTTPGNSVYWTCSACGKFFGDADGEAEIEKDKWIIPAKGHTYDNTDELYGDVKDEATCRSDEVRWDKCTVCEGQSNVLGDTATQTIANTKAEHSFTSKDSGDMKSAATCTTHQQNYVQCDYCDATTQGTNDEKAVEVENTKLEHVFEQNNMFHNGLTDQASAADCENAATYYVWCDRGCGTSSKAHGGKTIASNLEEDKATGHSYTNMIASAEMASDVTCTEAKKYYVQCDHCDYVNHELTVDSTKADEQAQGHSYTQNKDSGVLAQEATCHSLQSNFVKCDNCDYYTTEKTVEIAGTLKEHKFENKIKSDVLAEKATCTLPAKYYVKCENAGCTAVSDTETVEFGDPADHSFIAKASNQQVTAATCTEAATYKVQCENCDAVTNDKTVANGEPLGHLFEATGVASGVMAKEATCTTKELRYVLCSRDDCNEDSHVMEQEGKEPIVVEVGAEPVGHQYTEKGDVVSANDCKNNTPAVWKGKCSVCGEQSDSEEHYIKESVKHGDESFIDFDATCDLANGYKVICADCEQIFETVYYEDGDDGYIARLGHDYSAEFEWTGYTAAKVTLTCGRDGCDAETEGHVEILDCVVTTETTDATCAAEGKTVYTAKVTVDGKVYTDTKEEAIEKVAHNYGVSEFTWNEDKSGATATFTCSDCDVSVEGHSQTLDCVVTAETTDATCTAAGKTVYTATVNFGGQEYTDEEETSIDQLDHIYGAPTFTWSGTNACTATYTCSEGGETVENVPCIITTDSVDATCTTPGMVTFTASIQIGDQHYSDFKTETGVPMGHDYSAEFEWTGYTAAKVTLTCGRDGCDAETEGHVEILDCVVTTETTDATCAAAGKTVYTATVNFGGQNYTDEEETPIEKLAHSYGTPEFTWGTDKSSATATFTCSDCDASAEGHSQTVDCVVTAETTDATCVAAGKTVYTATVIFGHQEYTDVEETSIEKLEHIYGAPEFSWTADNSGATATFTCNRENCTGEMADHSKTLNCTVSSKTVVGTDCQTFGTITRTAVVEFNGQKYEDAIVSQGPIGGHDRVRTVIDPTCTERGYTLMTCKLCDELNQKSQYKDALGHDMAPATCTAPSTCRRADCDYTEGEKLPHSFTNRDSGIVASVANCTDPEKHFVRCDNCTAVSDTVTVAIGNAKGHSFNTKQSDQLASAATCMEAAKYYVQCDNCDEVTTTKTVSVGTASGHVFNEKASNRLASAATCTEAARYYVQCNNCNAVTTEKTVAVGGAKGHSFTTKKSDQLASAATCTETARYYVQCDNCTEVSDEKTVSFGTENGHKFNSKASDRLASAATCTEAAKYYVQCDNCDEVTITKTVFVGGAKGHAFNAKASDQLASAATCTEAARYYVQCDNCNAVTTEKAVVVGNAKGHSFTTKKSDQLASAATCTETAKYYVQCDNCSSVTKDKTVEVGTANGHRFNAKASVELAVGATCTTAARYYVQCDNCDKVTQDKTVAVGTAKGHSFTTKNSGIEVTPATCESKAVHKVQCDHCNAISNTVTVEVGSPLGHDMAPETCENPSTCKNGCGKTEGVALGHDMSKATCAEPSTCKNGCGKTEGEALPHTWAEEEEIPPLCEEPGYTAGKRCTVCGATDGIYKIAPSGHALLLVDAKRPTFGNPGWDAYERCINCNYTTIVYIDALPVPSITTYEQFIESLIILEQWAADYVKENPAKDALGMMIEYIRTGVDRYNSGSWNIMAGYEDPDFAKYISEREDEYNAKMENIDDMVKVTALKDIHEFFLPNGDGVDFGHMFGTMDITYHNNYSQNHADVAGWAGDLVDLLTTADRHNVYAPDKNGKYPTVEEMAATIGKLYLMHDIEGEDDQFGLSDMYGDLDGFYIMFNLQKNGYETGDLAKMMEDYFTEDLTDEFRAKFFLKNRLDGVTTRNAVREAVYREYVSNKVISTLEGTRDFKLDDISLLRLACNYAFADYLSKLGGDYVEVPDNEYYEVFESEFSNLAPGITQEIKKATTADNKQIVYYIATADITRSDVQIFANYNENDPTKGWKMSRVLDQALAAQKRWGDPTSPNYIENYNVITAINADGFNMSTGEPSGVLVMLGQEHHPVNASGFFGILKDGTAVIGTTAEYYEMKDQVKEAVGGFGTMLVDEGKIAVSRTDNYYSDRASRTAVGITRTGKVIFMVLDGRQEPVSCGGSMQEIAQIMLEAGCYYAINLDGGGSTTYVAKPEGEDALRVVNSPSDGFARSVSTSLIMVSTAPSSTAFDHAAIESNYDYLTPGSTVQLTAKGVSATGNVADIPEGAYWAVDDPTKATITEDGKLTGVGLGPVIVNLMVGDQVIGSKTIYVVNPDTVYFTRESLNAVYGAATELPVKALYQGKPVAINTADVKFTLSNDAAGNFYGFNFVAAEGTGLKVVKIIAELTSDSTKTGSINVSLYNQGEMSFDFDMATGGDRTIAWFRQVSNATTDDNNIYEVDKLGEAMVTTYTFALDMSQITMPEQLADLTYMLPGADAADASAWNFLLQLAERMSVLTNVTAKVYFDKNFDVDYSEMKIVCEYFIMNDAATDIVYNAEEHSLSLTLHWKDQTQAIDPETADPLCLLSGIKLTPKADAAWDAKDRLTPVHRGEITYHVFLRANALYTFASKEANQKEYGLMPFENPDVIIGGATEKGGSFKSTYVTFEDSYTLVNAVKNGWVGAEGGYMYYIDGEPHTGIQEVDGYYYDFGENGICIGQQKYNGLFEKGGKTYYARFGVLVKNDWMSVGDERYRFDENGAGLNGKVKIDEVELHFENGKLVGGFSGFVTKSDKNTYYYVNGVLTLGWYLLDGDWYHFDTGTGVMNTGTHVMPDAEAKSKGAYYDFAPDGKLLCGYFNGAGYYYWPELIDASVDSHAGTGRPKIDQWVQSGSVADDWPANGADKDAWYRTNSHGHFVTGGDSPKVFKYVVDGVTHNAIIIAYNNREYTFDNDHGYLLRGFFSYENGNWFYYWMDDPVNDGWFEVDGAKYYAYPDGHLATGSHVIDGEAYMFNERGALIETGLRLFVTFSEDKTQMIITTNGAKNLSNVRMAVWSEIGNQTDLRWFEAKLNSKGEWTVIVPLCQYENTGIYQIHTYGVNAEGIDGLVVNTTTNVAATIKHQAGEAVRENEVEAGCTVKGSYDMVVYCTVCDEELSRESFDIPAAHTPGKAVAENYQGAVCETGGSYDKVVYCTVCNTELSREKVDIPAGTHQPDEAVVENKKDATCTADGKYDSVVYCLVCSEELSREEHVIKATGHEEDKPVIENKVDATCTIDGSYDVVVYCKTCKAEISRETIVVSHEGHKAGEAGKENEQEPNCTEDGGFDLVVRCTVCEEILSTEHTELPASGHVDEDENGRCDVCKKKLSQDDDEEEEIETIAMHRLYNPNTGEHFYTGSEEERDMLVAAGWQYEGVAWNAPVKGGAPIYRLFNPNSGDHHFTGSEVERDMLVGYGWQYEGVAWNTMGETEYPQYRLYNPNADIGSHHYTGSIEERDYLVSLGWKYEGIGWYGCRK